MAAHIGNCKLCLTKEIELRNSHIIPKWSYRQVRGDSKDIVRLQNNNLNYSDQQLKEYLLCENCEQKIGVWENYVKSISFDAEGQSQAINLLKIEQSNNIDKFAYIDKSLWDRDRIAYFAASVVWRASIISRSGSVSLGSYKEELRKYLDKKAKFPQEASLLLYCQDPDHKPSYHQLVTSPVTDKLDKCHLHQFFCAGFLYKLFIGKTIPDEIKKLCLILREDPFIILTSFHHDPTMDRVKKTLGAAEIRGRLAERKYS